MSNPAKVKVSIESQNPTLAFFKDGSASVQSSLVNVGNEFKMKKYIQDSAALEDVMTVNEDGAVKFHKNVTFAGNSVIENVQTVILQDQKLEIGASDANQVNSAGVVKTAGTSSISYQVSSNAAIDPTKDLLVGKNDIVNGPGYTSLNNTASVGVLSNGLYTKNPLGNSITSTTNLIPTDATIVGDLKFYQVNTGSQQDITNMSCVANELSITYTSTGLPNSLENLVVGQLFKAGVSSQPNYFAKFVAINSKYGIIKSNASNVLKVVYTGLSLTDTLTTSATPITFNSASYMTNILSMLNMPSANRYQFTATDSNANFSSVYTVGTYVHFKGLTYTTGGLTSDIFNTSALVNAVGATTITVENMMDYTVANFGGVAVYVSNLKSIVDNSGISIIGNSNGMYVKGSLAFDNSINKNLKLENSAGPISIGADSSFYGINIGTQGNRTITVGNSTNMNNIALVTGNNANTTITSGTIVATAKNNIADAILLKTDNGTSQTITLNNTTGTAANAILLNAAVGGVQIKVADEKDAVISNSSADLYVKVSASASTANNKVSVVNTNGTDSEAILLNAVAGGAKIKVADEKNLLLSDSSENLFVKVSPSATAANKKVSVVNTNGTDAEAILLNAAAGGAKMKVFDEKNLLLGNSTEDLYFQVSPSATVANEKLSVVNTVGTAADSISINSVAGGLTFTAGGAVNVATNSNTGAVNIGTLGNRTITMGVNSGTSKIVLDAVDVIATNGFTASSDIRLKENFESIPNALELVSQLNGLYYTWKKDAGADKPRKLGFIAQEIEKVIPELVKTDSEGMKSVDYIGVVPVLVEALKNQQKQIDELKALLHA
jgi:hypothetical protein